jgi:hypothetical protein
MIRFLFKKLQDLLLPERSAGDRARDRTPADLLASLGARILLLAEQLEAHAEVAPYTQVAERLRGIAGEKRPIAHRLKEIIGNTRGQHHDAFHLRSAGKNHWERLIRDLEDQRALDDFLVRYEPTFIEHFPEAANVIAELKITHQAHRQSLLRLIAVADPQAMQT